VSQAFQIHVDDNVATLLGDADPGPLEVRGAAGKKHVMIEDTVMLGHKVALRQIVEGEPVIKFGVTIGLAARSIAGGEWVHLHNCRSRFDERSGDFDLITGATSDTRYE
jgi:altronate dehydratase small subunit